MPYYYIIKIKYEAVCIEYYACVYFALIIRHAKGILTIFHSWLDERRHDVLLSIQMN